jgi:hypothetical protein
MLRNPKLECRMAKTGLFMEFGESLVLLRKTVQDNTRKKGTRWRRR